MDPQRLQRILRQHVRTEQLFGIDSVPVAGEPRAIDAAPVEEEAVEAIAETEPALVGAQAGEPAEAEPVVAAPLARPAPAFASAPPRSPLFRSEPLTALD